MSMADWENTKYFFFQKVQAPGTNKPGVGSVVLEIILKDGQSVLTGHTKLMVWFFFFFFLASSPNGIDYCQNFISQGMGLRLKNLLFTRFRH